MEEWQKEIDFNKPLFFTGKLTAKYLGQRNNYLTDKDNQHSEHFEISHLYDLQITQIEEVNQEEYERKEKSFDVTNYDSIIGEYKGEKFALKPQELSILKGATPDHLQYEGDDIHGHFIDAPIVFKVLKPKKKIVCIEGAITNRETLDDGSIEITKIVDSETCRTETYILPVITKNDSCTEGAATGNQRTHDGWIEQEYTHSDCSTYWEKFKKVLPPLPVEEPTDEKCKPGYSGKTRKRQGWLQKEYITQDCNSKWEDYRPLVGCQEIFGYIILIISVIFVLGVLIALSQIQVIGLIILFGAGLIGLYYLIQFLSRFATFFVNLFRILLNLALIAGVVFMFYGLVQFFKSNHSRQERKVLTEDRSEDRSQVSPPRPAPVIDENNTEEDEQVDSIEQIEINLSWLALDGEIYQGSYDIDVPDVQKSYSYIRSINRSTLSSIGSVYSKVSNHDQSKMGSLYEMLDSIKTANKLSDRHFLDVIVSMVQSQEYVLVFEKSCSDPQALSDRTIRNLLNSGVSCEAFHPFGLKTPLEFLTNLTGDCDTRTVVLYTILKHYGYNVSIINSNHYTHSMLGVDIEGAHGSNKVYGGNNYYFWETTSKGFELGFLPQEANRIAFWEIVLN